LSAGEAGCGDRDLSGAHFVKGRFNRVAAVLGTACGLKPALGNGLVLLAVPWLGLLSGSFPVHRTARPLVGRVFLSPDFLGVSRMWRSWNETDAAA